MKLSKIPKTLVKQGNPAFLRDFNLVEPRRIELHTKLL
jgi:hypothetical protein